LRVLLAGQGVADIPDAKVIHHSVKDQTRTDNQGSRWRDNMKLSETYMPVRERWQKTFNQLHIYSGHTPWVHGQPPQ
jgi:hypothetical protein